MSKRVSLTFQTYHVHVRYSNQSSLKFQNSKFQLCRAHVKNDNPSSFKNSKFLIFTYIMHNAHVENAA